MDCRVKPGNDEGLGSGSDEAKNNVMPVLVTGIHVFVAVNSVCYRHGFSFETEILLVRVLINGLHAKSGGGVTYLRRILPVLAADPELEVSLCLHENQRSLFKDSIGDIGVHYARFKDGFYRRLLWEQSVLPFTARRLKAEVTFSPANFGPLTAPGPIILLRNALAVADEDRRPMKRLYWAALTFMTRASLLTCRRAIAVSAYAREALTEGVARRVLDRVTVIHHGVDGMFAPPVPGYKRGDFLLCVGDIYIQKNLHNLVEALSRVRDVFPDISLKVAGSFVDEDYGARVRGMIESAGLGDHVEFLGHIAAGDLVDLYRNCALFVHPSTVETFGNPPVEAMACGAPVVSSNAAAMPEVLGDAALFFDPRDVGAMADSIILALKDDVLRTRLSQKSIERARNFSWEETGRRTAQVIKDCVR